MGNHCLCAKKTSGGDEANPRAIPSTDENHDDPDLNQLLRIPQQCEEDPFGLKTHVYYENRFFPWRCVPTAMSVELLQKSPVDSTVRETNKAVQLSIQSSIDLQERI
ncbi:hypothetical protein DPEC_G00246160 [Dallia pectoralis]|uniref:Uncharacterized protein n=1 Tax=Dallia pectoralis TaxID=75939 RepID=A0ACC2FW66_DALPE|nr:hypothetical protein DPEC_G00246160 [Dallia pectoralis]